VSLFYLCLSYHYFVDFFLSKSLLSTKVKIDLRIEGLDLYGNNRYKLVINLKFRSFLTLRSDWLKLCYYFFYLILLKQDRCLQKRVHKTYKVNDKLLNQKAYTILMFLLMYCSFKAFQSILLDLDKSMCVCVREKEKGGRESREKGRERKNKVFAYKL